MDKFYLTTLCRAVEKRFGCKVQTTEDFSKLSDAINKATGERLSVSTLKRCWGRVNNNQDRRQSTLSILASYAGYNDWNSFIETMRVPSEEESDFKSINALNIERLPIGSQLKISWLPNREIKIRYLGQREFLILESMNAKLCEGDIIEISLLAPNEPMFISRIKRNQKFFTGYLAGQLHGVNVEHLD